MSELSIDTFGEIVDNFLKKAPVQMLIEMPEGTIEPEIDDNVGLGGVVQFYILLQALKPIYKSIHDDILDHSQHENFIDTLLALVKKDLMDVAEGDST